MRAALKFIANVCLALIAAASLVVSGLLVYLLFLDGSL